MWTQKGQNLIGKKMTTDIKFKLIEIIEFVRFLYYDKLSNSEFDGYLQGWGVWEYKYCKLVCAGDTVCKGYELLIE